jgi:hypothetical protein
MAKQSTSNFMGVTDGQKSQSNSGFREFSDSRRERMVVRGCGHCRCHCTGRSAPRGLILDHRAGADPDKTMARQMI